MCVLVSRSEDRQPEKKPKEVKKKEEQRSKAIGREERVIKLEQKRKLRKLSLQAGGGEYAGEMKLLNSFVLAAALSQTLPVLSPAARSSQ